MNPAPEVVREVGVRVHPDLPPAPRHVDTGGWPGLYTIPDATPGDDGGLGLAGAALFHLDTPTIPLRACLVVPDGMGDGRLAFIDGIAPPGWDTLRRTEFIRRRLLPDCHLPGEAVVSGYGLLRTLGLLTAAWTPNKEGSGWSLVLPTQRRKPPKVTRLPGAGYPVPYVPRIVVKARDGRRPLAISFTGVARDRERRPGHFVDLVTLAAAQGGGYPSSLDDLCDRLGLGHAPEATGPADLPVRIVAASRCYARLVARHASLLGGRR